MTNNDGWPDNSNLDEMIERIISLAGNFAFTDLTDEQKQELRELINSPKMREISFRI